MILSFGLSLRVYICTYPCVCRYVCSNLTLERLKQFQTKLVHIITYNLEDKLWGILTFLEVGVRWGDIYEYYK